MTKGEQRFEVALMRCLFPKGVPPSHRVNRTPQHEATLRAIHIIGKDIAESRGLELLDDTDEEA